MEEKQAETSGQFQLHLFGRHVLVYSAGNGLLFLFGLIQLFIIPKYLSVESYGYWQFFMLYGNYTGILHLGFINGIYMKWAGKGLNQVGSEITMALRFLLLEQLAVIVPLGVVTYFLLQPPYNWIGIMILISAFIVNLAVFFILTTQAIRQFVVLTVLNVGKGFVFLALIISLFTTSHLEYQYVIVAFITSYLVLLLALAVRYRRHIQGSGFTVPALVSFGKKNIRIGMFILLGNFVFVIFSTLDRLLVSSFFTIEQFAVYAFAIGMVGVASLFVKSVADVLFPYLSAVTPEQRTSAYQPGKVTIIFCWAAFLVAYFPLAALIEFYLPQYTGSLPIMKVLLGTVGLSSLILILQVNYYWLYRKQRQYFIMGITALALAVLLALIAIKMLGTLESVAIAILICFLALYIINGLSLKAMTGESSKKMWKDLIIMSCYFTSFWLSSFVSDKFIIQMFIYAGIFCVITWILLRKEVKELVSLANALRNRNS